MVASKMIQMTVAMNDVRAEAVKLMTYESSKTDMGSAWYLDD